MCVVLVCVFESSEREQKAKGNGGKDKTAPVRNPTETSAHNFPVSIATASEAPCRRKYSSDFPAALLNTQFRLVGHQ